MKECSVFQEGENMGYSSFLLREKIKPYVNYIDGVLLDPSGGRGIWSNPQVLIPLIETLTEYPDLDIGIAGGLCKETIPQLEPLLKVCPRLFFDAEGKLRDPESDSLVLEKVFDYLQAAFKLCYPLS